MMVQVGRTGTGLVRYQAGRIENSKHRVRCVDTGEVITPV